MKNKLQIDEVKKIKIESICKRLKGSVSSIDILNWLTNFDINDQQKALTILSKLDYITEHELIELLNERLGKIISLIIPSCRIIIHPSGEYGKSGTLMIYYLKKTPNYSVNAARIEFYETHKILKNEKKISKIKPDTVLIILDDFMGSGLSFINYYKTFVEPQIISTPNISKQFILSIFHLERAEKAIIKKYGAKLELVSEIKYPAFSSKESAFGYREKMLTIRECAHTYGKNLFSVTDRETGVEKHHPLGYENSQALIIFPYNSPNNTLPIFWSSKNEWQPLFPRSNYEKINKSKAFRKELAFNLGLLRDSEVAAVFYSGSRHIGWKSFNFVTKTDFAIFAILNMIRQKRAVPIICQELGINETDFNSYITQGIDKGVFDVDKKITEYGERIYFDAVKKLKYFKRERNQSLEFEMKEINYVSKTFKGRS